MVESIATNASRLARTAGLAAFLLAAFLLAAQPVWAQEAADSAPSAAEIGKKLSDPTSNVWAMFTEFDLQFSDGDVNADDPQVSGATIFQPILPFPLYGEGADAWKMLVRPIVPLVYGAPIPTGLDRFDHKSGIGDSLLPMLIIPPAGNWILGLGPTFLFPTSTSDVLGKRQFAMGPTAIVGYKTKDWTAFLFPQYFFGIGSRGDQDEEKDASNLTLLYGFLYNLPEAWQVGFVPSITYNDKAQGGGNKWNVPVGLMVTKTTIIKKRPVKFQFGVEYSAVSEDDFGKRMLFRLNVIPVIQGLVQKPIFGGS